MTDDNTKLADDLVVTSINLIRWLRAEDAAPQLTGPQASALAIIVFAGGIKPSALAKLEQVKRPTIARTIGQLVDKELVARVDNPDDARSVFLEPTKKGKDVIKDGQLRRIQPLRQSLDKTSEVDRAVLEKALPIIKSLIMA